ncbi:ubiquinol-cytochrome c reductase iron-sulfur subunit [Acetobacter sp. TBRC 12305]|uniref:Ubiquinol-cytochrome c reductase iron-sulfur subunit n=1 Tax=Acetobacter garciniae TaxID=2817435 RepID=A0A939KR61_9PROT|nr:ubiquinol-cytochrome c reductase iron-sulfur subunit [Acetobacter garciniae]MBO1326454.1 ubiquinol-cytochrome c reductase iron-sulfur subunit [Acetobacter garciniae]MBX0346091.1 ubiquinol-cytochrome c reductase iron-sulfur subunit [Acetobacter garciniae]
MEAQGASPDGEQDYDGSAESSPGRRDFLGLVATTTTVTGLAACAVPFVDSLKPQDSLAARLPLDIDISRLAPGQQMTVSWQGKPVFIVRRTPEALAALQSPALTQKLRDADSTTNQQPPYARNWHRSVVAEYGVYVGICTHLGCVPSYTTPQADGADNAGSGGYACPCHGSHFDLAGRVYKDVPAPYNLPVPPYVMPSPTTLRLGENPPGQHFDFSTIEQI